MPGGIISALILSTLISIHSIYWFFPLIFGIFTLVGYFLKKPFLVDIGIVMTILSYLFINRGMAMGPISLLVVIVVVLLFIGLWFLSRNAMLVRAIRKDADESILSDELTPFIRTSSQEILSLVVGCIILSISASMMATNSSLELDFIFKYQKVFIIVFSSLVFLIIYLMLRMFSKDKKPS